VLLGLGVRGIPLGPRWSTWNVVGISMTLVPFITFVLEILAIVFVFVLAVLYISTQPSLMAQVEILATKIYTIERTPEAILDLVAPLLLKPGILAIALSFFSLMVPMIEELVKPLGVWLFANQIRSRAQGFALGALGGATYALIETLGVTPQAGDWATTLLTRLGTDILHVTTSALMGAAIVYAIRERHYLRLLGTYLACVFLHGLWNGLAILFTFSTLASQYKQNLLHGVATPAAVAVAALAAGLLLILILANRRMRASQPTTVTEDLVP
ncbi:MAG: PrsW family glutamic-type intramembrane protease, partial [Bacteroidota bacterium]